MLEPQGRPAKRSADNILPSSAPPQPAAARDLSARSGTPPPPRPDASLDALLAAGAALTVFVLLGPLLRIPLHLPLGYNEGWNAYFAARAVTPGLGPLYPPADTLVFNNYPPLSFYVVGALGRYVTGDVIVAGRILALASLLASAALVAICVRRLGGSVRGGITAGLLVLLYAGIVFRQYLAVDEPQWFGHALGLGGLAVLLGGHDRARFAGGRIVAAALLMTAGGLVKHLLIGLPLAVTLWLAIEQRRAAAIWLAAASAAVGSAVLLTLLVHGHDALDDIFRHHRVYEARRLIEALKKLLPLLPMLAIAGIAWRARRASDAPMLFALLFVVVATVVGIVERTGQGVNYNAHFEALLACCLVTGLAISRAHPAQPSRRRGGGVAIGPALLAGIAAAPLLLFMRLQVPRAWQDIADSRARAAAWQPVIARIAASPGLAGCETLSLCFWAGKPYAVDAFNLNQDILAGGGSIARFDDLARAHGFGVFEFSDAVTDADGTIRLKPDPLLQDLVRHGYRLMASGPEGSVLLMP